MNKVVVGAVSAAVLAVGLSACQSNFQEPFRDAPRGNTNDDKADVILMPDGFSNVSSKCDGPNRVYTVYHNDQYGAVAVVPNDPRCD